VTRSDDDAARRHALLAEQHGNPEAANLLRRYHLL